MDLYNFIDATGKYQKLNIKDYDTFDFYLSSEHKIKSLLTRTSVTESVLHTLIQYELATRKREGVLGTLVARYFKLLKKRIYKEMLDYVRTENRTVLSERSSEAGRDSVQVQQSREKERT